MLVLSRKIGETICVSDNITITLVEIRGDKVRLGITAPRDVPVHREEVKRAIDQALQLAKATEVSSRATADHSSDS